MEDRLINGTEKIFSLPTPLDILKSEYFADYRKPLTKKSKKSSCKFSYEMKPQPQHQPIICDGGESTQSNHTTDPVLDHVDARQTQ